MVACHSGARDSGRNKSSGGVKMWWTVLKLEWRILRRDRGALGVLVLFAIFLLGASLAGGRQSSALDSGLERSKQEERARFDGHTERLEDPVFLKSELRSRDSRSPAWMGKEGAVRLASLPAAPLAPLALGQRDLYPQAIRISTEVFLTSERETETAMSGPTRLMTGSFDPAFLFVVLFPLLIIALSYEILSGERERGTLAMLLSQPVTQRALVMGKAGARAVGLCAVTLFFAALGLLAAGANLSAPQAWIHVILFVAILVAWSLFWFSASVAVNSFGGTSARNALALVGVWLVLVVVIPGLVHVAVDTFHPPPSRMELVHESREAAKDVEKRLTGIEGRHDVDTRTTGYARKVAEAQEQLAERSSEVFEEFREKNRRRQGLVRGLQFISPAIVVQLVLEDLAGSGAARHQIFDEQVDGFHARFRNFFFSKIKSEGRFTAEDLSSVPAFQFEEERISELAGRCLWSVFLLLLAASALIGLAWPRLKHIGRLTR